MIKGQTNCCRVCPLWVPVLYFISIEPSGYSFVIETKYLKQQWEVPFWMYQASYLFTLSKIISKHDE